MTKKSTSSLRKEITGKAKKTVMASASCLLKKSENVLLVAFFAGAIYTKCIINLIKVRSKDKA